MLSWAAELRRQRDLGQDSQSCFIEQRAEGANCLRSPTSAWRARGSTSRKVEVELQKISFGILAPMDKDLVPSGRSCEAPSTGGGAELKRWSNNVNVPLPQIRSERVDLIQLSPRDRTSNRVNGQLVSVPVPRVPGETGKVIQHIDQERIYDQESEQNR